MSKETKEWIRSFAETKNSVMNTALWILQALIAFVFLFSGVNKSIFSEKQLVAKGQTGVEGLPLPLIRFIGITEILGAVGITLPWWLDIYPILTPISAICFAVVMVLAAVIHYRRKEYKNVGLNIVFLLVCLLIIYGRFYW